jgi:ABC-type transporter Mla MlaB component
MTNGATVYDDGVLRITSTSHPPGLTFEGEIDESTYPALVHALQVSAKDRAEVHFSLGGVRYCDLAGLRAIVRTTGIGGEDNGDGHANSRRVVLHEVPAQLLKVMRIVGWDATPGLAVDQPADGIPPGSASQPEADRPGSAAW